MAAAPDVAAALIDCWCFFRRLLLLLLLLLQLIDGSSSDVLLLLWLLFLLMVSASSDGCCSYQDSCTFFLHLCGFSCINFRGEFEKKSNIDREGSYEERFTKHFFLGILW
jgi:hypothetical protein